ncbi:MAG: hypothetical protein N2484_16530 [Clostridia bacterium]|nr:hypothetical protein [Clostridia bacterium]
MNNQLFLWTLFILPWITVFFMQKEDIKRFIPAALLSTIISIIVVEVGVTLNWWVVKESAYPLRNLSYIYSLNPVITLWLLRFTYGQFRLYLALDIVVNLGFSYFFIGFILKNRDILQYTTLGPLHVFVITTVTGILIYGYQMWQDDIFERGYRRS